MKKKKMDRTKQVSMNVRDADLGRFDYNQSVTVDVAQSSSRDFWIRPLGGTINQAGPWTFTIEPTPDHYLDLNSAGLEMKYRIVRADGSNLRGDRDIVAPVNLLGPCMWSSVEVTLNGHPFNSSSQILMGHKQLMETVLTYDTDSANTHLQTQGWDLDSPQGYDCMKPGLDTMTNALLQEMRVGAIPRPPIPDDLKADPDFVNFDRLRVHNFDNVRQILNLSGKETVADLLIMNELDKQDKRYKLYKEAVEVNHATFLRKYASIPGRDASNKGYDARYSIVKDSAHVDMYSPIPHDFFRLDNHVGPNNRIVIRLTRYPDNFLLNSPMIDKGYKLVIDDMKLHIHTIKLRDSISLPKIERYLMSQTEMHRAIIPARLKTYTIRLHGGGVMPKTIIIGMTDTDAADGNYKKNPWNFKSFNVSRMTLNINGIRYPTAGGLEFDFDAANGLVARGYQWMYQNTGRHATDRGNVVSWPAFKNGSFIVPFDLTPDRCNRRHNHKAEFGFIDLEVEFRQDIDNALYVFYEKVFPKMVVNDHTAQRVSIVDVDATAARRNDALNR